MLGWGWADSPNVFIVFIHLLITANYEKKKWHEIFIERGQLVTSLEHFASECGLSIAKTRLALNKLKKTGEITIKTTTKYTVLTAINYNAYQLNDKQMTNKQQTNDKQMTTTKEYKNIRNKEYIYSITQDILNSLKGDFPLHDVESEWTKAKDWLSATGKTYKDYQAFFRNWLRRATPALKKPLDIENLREQQKDDPLVKALKERGEL